MSALSDVLAEFARRGIRMRVVGDAVKLGPKSALDTNLIERARGVKGDLIRMLSARPETCSPECYEIEPGRWIHRPWAGCTTSRQTAEATRAMVELECWHCRGEKRCNCSSCSKPENACAVCGGTGFVRRWIQ